MQIPRLPFALDPLIAEAKRRARRRRYLVGLGLVAAVAIATGLTLSLRPGASGGRSVASHPAAYSGPLYSVADVKRAFAALGLQLHRESTPSPGLVYLVNNLRLGPQLIPSTPRIVTVVVATLRAAVGSSTAFTSRWTI